MLQMQPSPNSCKSITCVSSQLNHQQFVFICIPISARHWVNNRNVEFGLYKNKAYNTNSMLMTLPHRTYLSNKQQYMLDLSKSHLLIHIPLLHDLAHLTVIKIWSFCLFKGESFFPPFFI